MNLLAEFKHLRFSRVALSVSAAALIGASGHKAAQYAQSAWGDEGLVLVVAGAVAAFYALHTAFNDKARRSARVWAAAAALGLGLLEGGAIMQGNIEAATVAARNTHADNIVKWTNTKTALDSDYRAAYQQWQTDKAAAETEVGNTKTALRQELQSVKEALAENAKSQRMTKASDKEGNVTPAYQALLDQQASLLKRSESINAELGKTATLPAAPAKPVYPNEPVQAPITLAPVEYAQAFAFPALVVVLMFLRGRREEENAALAELADIQSQATVITRKLDTALGNAEQRITALLASIQTEGAHATRQIQDVAQGELSTLQHQISQCQRLATTAQSQTEAAVTMLRQQTHAMIQATQRDLQALATNEQTRHQAQLAQLQTTAIETLKNADTAARAISQRTAIETAESLQAILTEAKTASADLQKQVIHCNAVLAKSNVPNVPMAHVNVPANVPAMYLNVPEPKSTLTTEVDKNTNNTEKLSKNDALNLLRLQQVKVSEEGLVISSEIEYSTGYGRKLAEKLREYAINYGYLIPDDHGKGKTCRYPASIPPDRHSHDQAPVKTNVFNLVKRG
jgi:Capsule polysaccharide export protein